MSLIASYLLLVRRAKADQAQIIAARRVSNRMGFAINASECSKALLAIISTVIDQHDWFGVEPFEALEPQTVLGKIRLVLAFVPLYGD